MAEMGSHETELSKTISGAERDRRVAAVNYARASVLRTRISGFGRILAQCRR